MSEHRKFLSLLLLFCLTAPATLPAADNPTYTYPESVTQAISNADTPAPWLLPDTDVVTIPDPGGAHGLRYDASGNLIVRNLGKSGNFVGKYVNYPNYTIYGNPTTDATFVTTGNDFTTFYDTYGNGATNTDLIKITERGLGIDNTGTHNAIIEFTVTPDVNTIIRPTKKPDIATYNPAQYGNSDVDFPFVQPDGMSNAAYNNFKAFYAQWVAKAYTQPFDPNKSFPFTQLAYTFFWGHGSKTNLDDIKGLSEFILLGGTSANIYAIYAAPSYIYTKNNGEYGNGFPNFNVTGPCSSLWAGAAFQAGTSLDAAIPNTITVGAAGDISGGEGILVDSQNYIVTNAGTITANAGTKKFNIAGTEDIALLFKGASYAYTGDVKNVLNNSGTITGPAAGTAVKVLAGNTDITNTGTITGPAYGIWLLGGTNTITNSGTITGTATAAIRLGGGTTAIANTGTINGNVTMDANSGATLDVGANNLTLSAGGIYTQGAGTTLALTAYSSSHYGKVTAAGVAINPASSVNVTVGDYIPNNMSFKIVDTSGTGVGSAPGTITSNSEILVFSGSDATGDLIITATRAHPYNTLASTTNASAVGATLESVGSKATGDMLTVLNTLDMMTSATQVSNSLESMHPDMSSGNVQGARAIANQFFTSVSARIGYARSGLTEMGISTGDMFQGTGVWFQGLGSHAKQDTRKGIEGYQDNTFGTAFGGDKIFGDHVRLGAAGGYGYADVKGKTIGRPSSSINSFQGILYGSYDSLSLGTAREKGKLSEEAVRTQGENLWYVDGMFGFTQNNYDSRREIYLGDTTRVANATHYGQQYSTMLETGYTFVFKKTKALQVTPFVSLQHSYLYMDRYSEDGADALNLTVDGKGYNELEQGLGLKLAYPLTSKKYGTFIPTIRGAWLYDYMGERIETTSSFAGGGPSFVTSGARPAQAGALFGASVIFLNKGNLTLTGNYDWEVRDQYGSHTYYSTVRADF